MSEKKFSVPTEIVDLPSRGLIYSKDNALSSGSVEMKYMTAKEEDILTNVNFLRQGIAIEKMMKSLIKSDINYEDLIIGDRNGLLIACRILAYGKDYTFKYPHPKTGEDETITVDLQTLGYKEIDYSKLNEKNEFTYELPYSKNTVTFKLLTVADDKKIDEEIKSLKKTLKAEAGTISTRLKYQITSVEGDRSIKSIRDFIEQGYLLSRDSIELRKEMTRVSPDIDTKVTLTFSDGEQLTVELPLGAEFFFPGSGV